MIATHAVSISLALAVLTISAHADNASWKFRDQQACFRIDHNEACLPKSFRVDRITQSKIQLVDRSRVSGPFFLNYEPGKSLNELVEEYVNERVFKEREVIQTNGVKIYGFDTINEPASHPKLSVIILEFGKSDLVVLRGPASPDLEALGREMVLQWQPSSA